MSIGGRYSMSSGRFWRGFILVIISHKIQNDVVHRQLLFNRCILQYGFFNEDSELQSWYDVHPLILGIKEFKTVLKTLEEAT